MLTKRQICNMTDDELRLGIRQMSISLKHVYSRKGRKDSEKLLDRLEEESRRRTIGQLWKPHAPNSTSAAVPNL